MPFVNLRLHASLLFMIGTVKTIFLQNFFETQMFCLRFDSISGALESNLLGPRGGQRGTLVTSQFHLRATSTRQNLAENPDISFVEGSHFFHFSLKKEPKDSALSHTAPHWLLINCILTSESLAAVANKFWLVVLVYAGNLSSSSCSWHCWVGPCPSVGFPCLRSKLGQRPGSPTSCRRSYLQVSQTQPENVTLRLINYLRHKR